MKKQYTFVDLFAGCGGFSEGFYKEGFKALAHVEIDKNACETLKERMRYYNYGEEEIEKSVLCRDLTDKTVKNAIQDVIGDIEVDVLVGGPPCQAFSSVGRAQDKDSMQNDPRNYLFYNYIDILEKLKPKLFVFENVTGLLTAKPKGVPILPIIFERMSKMYKINTNVDEIVLNSVNYGVPQIRKRVIIIGVRKDIEIDVKEIYKNIIKTNYGPEDRDKGELKKYYTIKDALEDLPILDNGEGKEEIDFVTEANNEYIDCIRDKKFGKLYNHVARKHNDKDRERYRILSENCWTLRELEKVRPDLVHHDPNHFVNRYTVQRYDLPGRTVVAHLYKDGNLFIHPDYKQARTFTVREAARVQSFPDDFKFVGARTHQYKQVGNAVPPLMAQAIAKSIKIFLDKMQEQ